MEGCTATSSTRVIRPSCAWNSRARAHATCAWSASGALSDLQPQGWETGSILNTDGVHHVGWAFYDVDHSKMTAKLSRIPHATEVPYPVQMEPNLVIEYYSR